VKPGPTPRGGVMSFDSLPLFLFIFFKGQKIIWTKNTGQKNSGQKKKKRQKNNKKNKYKKRKKYKKSI